MKWYPFEQAKGYRQKRPPIKRHVLVRVATTERGTPDMIAVGYRKDAAGDKSCPYFVVPGRGGEVVAWCDCLPDFEATGGPWQDSREYASAQHRAVFTQAT